MNKKLILSTLAFVCCGTAFAEDPVKDPCESKTTIANLKDNADPTGLNLDNVDARQNDCRKLGVGDDITTKIILLRVTKDKMAEALAKADEASRSMIELDGKIESEKKRKKLKKLTEQRTQFEMNRDREVAMAQGLAKVIASQEEELMEKLGLTPDQVGKIPGQAKPRSQTHP